MPVLVGLGNPGGQYSGTRHNLGFMAVHEFARAHGIKLKEERSLKALVGEGVVSGISLSCLLPMNYMNCSGEPVKRFVKERNCSISDLLIVCDDVALDLGMLRIRAQGSCGGHNGLRDIEAALGTQYYARLRMGVGAPYGGESLEDFVLGRFTKEEMVTVSEMIDRAQGILELWLLEGISAAMQKANQKKET